MSLHLNIIPGYSDLADSVLVAGDPARALHVEEISANAAFGMCRYEIFQGLYFDGDTVPLPESGIDGYRYSREECFYIWNPNLSTNKDSGWIVVGSGSLWFCNWDVDQATGEVFSSEWYRNSGSGGTRTETNDGAIEVYTIAQRQRQSIIMSASPTFSTINPADIATDKPLKQSLAQGLNQNAKFAVVNKEAFYLGEFTNGQQIPRGGGSALVSPIDGYQYAYAECKFQFSWRWTTDGNTFTQPPENYSQMGWFKASIDATGHVTLVVTAIDNDGNFVTCTNYGRIAAFALCTRSATPATAPLADDFAEIDEAFFYPGSTLRASNVLAIKKNIDEAILAVETFGPTTYHDGGTVPLPVSAVDGYHYTRDEITYVWSWSDTTNTTGPHARVPLFYGYVTQATGAVALTVWRLPPGGPYVVGDAGLCAISVLVVARRQQALPAIIDNNTVNAPSDVATASVGQAIQINGVATSGDLNFNDTLPAAPAGKTNVKWQYNPATNPSTASAYVDLEDAAVAGITIDGGASTPTTGSKGYLQVPFAATITGWTLLADASGSAQITVKKCSDAGFPTTASIVASAPPLISSAQKGESSTLTGWTTAITANDILEFNLDSVTTCKRLTLELKLTRI